MELAIDKCNTEEAKSKKNFNRNQVWLATKLEAVDT